MKLTYLESLYEETFGHPFDASVQRTVMAAPEVVLNSFIEAYRSGRDQRETASRSSTDLAPYLPTTIDMVESGIGLLMGIMPASHNVGSIALGDIEISNVIRPLLLYAHRVAIDDPIDRVFPQDSFTHKREHLANVLESLRAAAPLLRNDILTLVPRRENAQPPELTQQELDRLSKLVDPQTLKYVILGDILKPVLLSHLSRGTATVETLVEVLQDTWFSGAPVSRWEEQSTVGALLREITEKSVPAVNWVKQAFASFEATRTALDYRSDLDFYFPHAFYTDLYDHWLRRVELDTASHPQEPLMMLGDLALPALDRLSMADIVAIRQSSEAFDEWRLSLSNALDRGTALSLEERRRPQVVKEAFWDELAPGYRRVTDELKRLGVAATARGMARTFGIGALGGLVGGVADQALKVGLGSAAVGASAQAGDEFIRNRKRRKTRQVLQRHFLVFRETPSS